MSKNLVASAKEPISVKQIAVLVGIVVVVFAGYKFFTRPKSYILDAQRRIVGCFRQNNARCIADTLEPGFLDASGASLQDMIDFYRVELFEQFDINGSTKIDVIGEGGEPANEFSSYVTVRIQTTTKKGAAAVIPFGFYLGPTKTVMISNFTLAPMIRKYADSGFGVDTGIPVPTSLRDESIAEMTKKLHEEYSISGIVTWRPGFTYNATPWAEVSEKYRQQDAEFAARMNGALDQMQERQKKRQENKDLLENKSPTPTNP